MNQPKSRKKVNKVPQIPRPKSVLVRRDPKGQLVVKPQYVYVRNTRESAANISQKGRKEKKEFHRFISFISALFTTSSPYCCNSFFFLLPDSLGNLASMLARETYHILQWGWENRDSYESATSA